MAEESATTPVDAGRPRRRRRALRVLGWVLAVVLALALVGTGYGVWTVRRSFPTTSGTVSVAGLAHDATVRRDARGIPTITAETPRGPLLRAGVRPRAGPVLGDGLPAAPDERAALRAVRGVAGAHRHLPADARLAARRRAGGRGPLPDDPDVLRVLRGRGERLPRRSSRRGPLARTRPARAAEPGLRARAVGARGLRRLAEGDGLGSGLERGRRGGARSRGAVPRRRRVRGALPGLPLRRAPGPTTRSRATSSRPTTRS